jgi:hypothetical protein
MKRLRWHLFALVVAGLGLFIYFLIKTPVATESRDEIPKPPSRLSTAHPRTIEPARIPVERHMGPEHRPVAVDSHSFSVEQSSNATGEGTGDIVVPIGSRVPAALMDGGSSEDSLETKAIINAIIEEFTSKINDARKANANPNQAWEDARSVADERYQQFFGFEAYNAATLETAGEADEEATLQTPPSLPKH